MPRKRKGLGTRKIKRGTVAVEAVVAGPPLPPSAAFKLVTEFHEVLREYEQEGGPRRIYVATRYEELFGKPPPSDVHWRLPEIRIGYELQYRGFKNAGCLELLSKQVIDNRRTATLMEVDAYPDSSLLRALTECRMAAERKESMARKKAGKKATGEKRKTISGMVIEILGGKKVPTNEDIVAAVKKAFPDSKFDAKHLAWYKNRFVQGLLPGQDGKAATVAQEKSESTPGRKKAASKKTAKKKTAKKKKVVRRKAS
jgi:hypothetical protein